MPRDEHPRGTAHVYVDIPYLRYFMFQAEYTCMQYFGDGRVWAI